MAITMKDVIESPSEAAKKFKYIQSMPSEYVEQFDALLYKGETVPNITKMVQEEWKLLTKIAPKTLEQYIYRYKHKVIVPAVMIASDAITPKSKLVVLEKIKGTIDVLEEVGQLVAVQKSRVKKLLDREREMPMLFNTLGKEIQTLSGLIGQYADIAVDFGVIAILPKITKVTTNGVTTTVESEGRAHVAEHAEQNRRVEEATKLFFDTIEGVYSAES